jgi:drug/metabolite transporter (DMT)-like permease
MVLIILLYALFAATFPLQKLGLSDATPLLLVTVRMLLGGLLLLSHQVFFNRKSCTIALADLFLFIQVALVHIYIPFITEYWALQYISSFKLNILYSFSPFISALLSYLLLKESLGVQKILGLMVGLSGLIPLIIKQNSDSFSIESLMNLSLPECMMLGGIASAAYAWFIIKRLMNKGYSLIFINGFGMLLGGIACAITLFATTPLNQIIVSSYPHFIGYTLLLILISNIIGYNLYGYLLKHHSLTLLSFAGFLCPIFGAFYGKLIFNERIGLEHLTALGMILCGLYLFYRDEHKV